MPVESFQWTFVNSLHTGWNMNDAHEVSIMRSATAIDPDIFFTKHFD